MPEENGLEFMRAFRKTSQLPAIALTAYVREEEIATALEAGFQAHVAKPINTQALIGEIRRLLSMN